MTRQSMKRSQIGPYWQIVIGIFLLVLLVGTIVVTAKTVCEYRTELVANMDPLPWQFVKRVEHGWHCMEFAEFVDKVNKKVVPRVKSAMRHHPI